MERRRKRGRKREWSIGSIKEDRGGRRERRRREINKCTQIKTCLIMYSEYGFNYLNLLSNRIR